MVSYPKIHTSSETKLPSVDIEQVANSHIIKSEKSQEENRDLFFPSHIVVPENLRNYRLLPHHVISDTVHARIIEGRDKIGRRLTVKVFWRTSSPEERAKITEELSLLQSVQKHRNIIRLLAVVEQNNIIFAVMRSFGQDLLQLVNKNGRFLECSARHLTRQVLNALKFCHKHGVVHGDVKLDNILLSRSGHVRLIDLGSARRFEPHNRLLTSERTGTPGYMAPEIICEKNYDGTLADVYSLGVTLYAMTVGYLPFADQYDPVTYYSRVEDYQKAAERNALRPLRLLKLMGLKISKDLKTMLREMLSVLAINRPSLSRVETSKWMKMPFAEGANRMLNPFAPAYIQTL
eukprot:TRINITY_DN10947_c0_g1_i1.p1 TRINITY_DN10947_c0_g1~~TRINITY_DN10947_c0_g1_i1.p1  ORF type:complete len:348 (+),score=45.16 TRINITY_DN10947_c0_g1_i1:119-1162(+)